MVEEFTTTYSGRAGKQHYTAFEGGEKDTLTTTFSTGIESHTEATAMKGIVIDVDEENLEIKSKP
jgi:hypothetical protein